MWQLVTAAILLLIALGLFLANKVKDGTEYDREQGKNVPRYISLRRFALIPGTLAVIVILMGSVYTQDPGEAVVLKSISGKVVDIDPSSGFGLKAPWTSKVTYNIRNQRIEMFSNAGGDGADGAAINCPLTGSSNAAVSITVRYSIKADAVENIYNVYRTQENLSDNALKPTVRDETRNACADYTPFQIKERRAELSSSIEELLGERWEDIGVVVDGVDLGDITLDKGTEEAIVRVNQAQLGVEEAQANLNKARVNAEETKTKALAEADADQIIRCGAEVEEVTEEVNGEETTTIVVTPKTAAECENLLNEQVLMTKWLEAIQKIGEDGNSVVIVPNDPSGGLQPILNIPQPQPKG